LGESRFSLVLYCPRPYERCIDLTRNACKHPAMPHPPPPPLLACLLSLHCLPLRVHSLQCLLQPLPLQLSPLCSCGQLAFPLLKLRQLRLQRGGGCCHCSRNSGLWSLLHWWRQRRR
jgi:hypothetical protein